jgi:hypothetical protein
MAGDTILYMNRTSRISLVWVTISALFLTVTLVWFLAPEPAFAAESLVPCNGTDCNFCHVMQLGNNVLNWLFSFVFVIFGVIIFVAGFGLVTSGGNQSKLDDAKKKLSNAVIGIIIIFAAWLIVDTLVKAVITDGNLSGVNSQLGPWNEIDCGVGGQNAAAVGGGGAADGGIVGGGSDTTGCPTCGDLPTTIPTNGRACPAEINGTGGCVVHPDMLTRIDGMGDDFTDEWQISEAYPPTVTHMSACHQNATCIDASWQGSGEPSAAEVQKFIDDARANNLVAEYEVANDTLAQALRDAGVTNVLVVPGVAPHFSVYMCDQTTNNACGRAGY